MDLKDIRSELNVTDEQITELLKKRYELVEKVADYKLANDIQILDTSRENEILTRIDSEIENRNYARHIVDTFRAIMSCSKDFQAKYIKNIVMIGMPGCGKSTIGKKIAEGYGYAFIDADEAFNKTYNMSAADCITQFGEAEFRRRETEVLKSFKADKHCVYALGGGAVTIEENYEIAKRLGTVVYVKRDLDKLASKGRPITASKGVEKLFEERREKYEKWADVTVENEDIKVTVQIIMAEIMK